MKKRKICVFTGSRAEYGLLKPLMELIRASDLFDLQVLASGMHLSPEFGFTIDEVRHDFRVDKELDILLSSDRPEGVCKAMGLGLIGFPDCLKALDPDLLIILGDRFEAFSLAAAALVCKVPVAHIHGGEVTEGAMDDAFRHAITKMSHLHFTCTEVYRQRVIQLGEMPERVFNVGSLCGDVLNGMSLLSRLELEKDLKMTLDDFILITYHPCTLGGTSSLEVLKNILSALDAYPKLNLVFTKANADTEGSRINTYLEAWCQQHERSVLKSNLGSLRYLSALKHCRCVVGNSSSGILEAPFFKTPTLNVGDRQKGRIKAKNVITVKEDLNAVQCGLQKALSSSFCDEIALMENPYEKGSCARSILKIISNEGFPLKVKKSFKDIN